jgi:hypothetical protein
VGYEREVGLPGMSAWMKEVESLGCYKKKDRHGMERSSECEKGTLKGTAVPV